MRNLVHFIVGILMTAGVTVVVSKPTMAQDPMKLSPKIYRLLLENDRVRVLEYHSKPGDKEPMHSHPPNLLYVLSASKLKFALPDGQSREAQFRIGEVLWREAETHTVENIGATDSRILIIELKQAPKK